MLSGDSRDCVIIPVGSFAVAILWGSILLEGDDVRRVIQAGSTFMRWFRALMPREERFFELFARHSDVVVAGAKALREMLDGGDSVARC